MRKVWTTPEKETIEFLHTLLHVHIQDRNDRASVIAVLFVRLHGNARTATAVKKWYRSRHPRKGGSPVDTAHHVTASSDAPEDSSYGGPTPQQPAFDTAATYPITFVDSQLDLSGSSSLFTTAATLQSPPHPLLGLGIHSAGSGEPVHTYDLTPRAPTSVRNAQYGLDESPDEGRDARHQQDWSYGNGAPWYGGGASYWRPNWSS